MITVHLRFFSLRFLSLLAAAFLFSVLLSYASDVPTGSGNWTNSSLWNNGEPTNGTSAIISGGDVMTISSAVPTIENFQLGGVNSSGGIIITTGGSLTATGGSGLGGINAVGRPSTSGSVTGVTGTLTMTGGSLTIQNYGLMIGGTGASYTNQSTATVTISGGVYSGGMAVGTTNTLSTGKLIVSGNAATIGSTSSSDTFAVNTYGTVDFVLTSGGMVTTLGYGNSAVTLGGTLDIDVSAYTGASETLNLINYNTVSGAFANMAVIGTGASNYTLSLGEVGNVVQATLTEAVVPEPQSWVLVFMGIAGLVGVVRRRASADS